MVTQLFPGPNLHSYLLSPPQEELLRQEQSRVSRTSCNNPVAVRVSGRLDPYLLQTAFQNVLDRHRGLAYRVSLEPTPRMEPMSEASNLDPVYDKSLTGRGAVEADWLPYIKELAGAPFDLPGGPLFRVRIVELAPNDFVLVFVTHRILADPPSATIVMRDWALSYDNLCGGRQGSLEPLTRQFGNFAMWQREWLGSGEYLDEIRFWKSYIGDVPLDVTLPKTVAQGDSSTGLQITFVLTPTSGFRHAASRRNGTVFTLLQTAIQAAVYECLNVPRFHLFVPFIGRVDSDYFDVVGPFATVLPTRCDIDAGDGPADMFARNAVTLPDVIDAQLVPSHHIVPAAAAAEGTIRLLFNLLTHEKPPFSSADRVSQIVLNEEIDSYGLAFIVSETDGAIRFDIKGDPVYIGEVQLRAISNSIITTLKRFHSEFHVGCTDLSDAALVHEGELR